MNASQFSPATDARPYELALVPVDRSCLSRPACDLASSLADAGNTVLLVTASSASRPGPRIRVHRPAWGLGPAVDWLQRSQRGRERSTAVLVIDAAPVVDEDGRAVQTMAASQIHAIHAHVAHALQLHLHAVQIFIDAALMPPQPQEVPA